MSMNLNKAAYARLIAEDIEWLMQQPRTLEREHIRQVLEHSANRYEGAGIWRGEDNSGDSE